MEQERATARESAFADLNNAQLIDQFYFTEGSPEVGTELSVRLLAHAGFAGDPTAEPLISRDGRQIYDKETGTPLVLADYINYATEHHFDAVEGILGFLLTKPHQPAYQTGQKIILRMLSKQEAGRS